MPALRGEPSPQFFLHVALGPDVEVDRLNAERPACTFEVIAPDVKDWVSGSQHAYAQQAWHQLAKQRETFSINLGAEQ